MNNSQVITDLEPYINLNKIELDNLKSEIVSKIHNFLDALEKGSIRAAFKGENGLWHVDERVKKGVLLAFKISTLKTMTNPPFHFSDKDIFSTQKFLASTGIRIVPGGTSVRRGAFIGNFVTMMPPAYVNVGAYVDENTMIDSHTLIGSCAQVGKNVHVSAAAQIGGVLEPIGALPVIIEDNVLVGGNTGIYEGCIVRKNAVLGAGVILTASTKVYDLPNQKVIQSGSKIPLEIPEGAVVIPGARPAKGDFALKNGLSITTPIIIKYKDDKTAAKIQIENALREVS